MKAYKTFAIVQKPKRIVLENVPFEPGERVEVVLLAAEQAETEEQSQMKALFRETQDLPQSRTITEEEIAAEIDAYRKEREAF